MRKQIQTINEGTKALIPPNADNSTPNGVKLGDTIKLLKSGYNQREIPDGIVFRCVNLEGEPYVDFSGVWSGNHYYKIIPTTGVESHSLSTSATIKQSHVLKEIASGNWIVLQPNQPYNQGELEIADIQDVIKNLDILNLSQAQMKDIISNSKEYFGIDFRGMPIDDETKTEIFKKLCNAFIKRGWQYGYSNTAGWTLKKTDVLPKGYPILLSIAKRV
jgi:hypothetical protein